MRDFPFLPPYVLAEELTEGRPVVDFHPGAGAIAAFEAVGLRGVVVLPPGGRIEGRPSDAISVVHATVDSIPVASDSAGVVLCPGISFLDDAERDRFLAEARRVVGPEGVLVATLPTAAVPTLLAPPAERGIDPAELQRAVRRHFPHIALVAQTPFLGYLLRRLATVGEPGDLVLSSALSPEAEEPVAHLAVCGARYRRFDANHIVQLQYLPFDETIRSRIDELADLAEASRWEATRAQSGLEKLKAEVGGLGERAKDAERLAGLLATAEARADEAETERIELRSRVLAQERALAAAMGAKTGAALRAKEAEDTAREQSAVAGREKKRAEAVATSLEAAQKENRDQSERLARLQRALDDREESLALARDERDKLAKDKSEADRKTVEAARLLEAARTSGLDADLRARSASDETESLRARLREAEGTRETATARAEAAQARLAGVEEELRIARADARRMRDELDAARAEAESERRERQAAADRARSMDDAREQELLASLEARDDMIRELRASVEARSASASRLDEEREILRRQISDARRTQLDAEARAEAAEESVRSLKKRVEEGERLGAEREVLLEEVSDQRGKLEELGAEILVRDEALARQKGLIDGIKHESRDAGKMLAQMEAEKETLLAHLSQREDAISELQGFLEEIRKDAESSSKEALRLEGELKTATKRIESAERQIVSMREAHEWEAASWQGEVERFEKELQTRSAKISGLERELESARKSTRTFQDRATQLSRETAVLQQEVARKKTEDGLEAAARKAEAEAAAKKAEVEAAARKAEAEVAVKKAEAAAKKGDAEAEAAAKKADAELRHALADEKARAAKAIEESIRHEATVEALSDAIAGSKRFRHAVQRLVRAAPMPKKKLEEEPTRRMEEERTTPDARAVLDDAPSFEEKTKPQ